MSHRNPLLDMALIFVACILIMAAVAANVFLKFYEARLNAEEAGAVVTTWVVED